MKPYGSNRSLHKPPPPDAYGPVTFKIVKARERRRKPYHFHVGWNAGGFQLVDVFGNYGEFL